MLENIQIAYNIGGTQLSIWVYNICNLPPPPSNSTSGTAIIIQKYKIMIKYKYSDIVSDTTTLTIKC